jgi:hypothetical protein
LDERRSNEMPPPLKSPKTTVASPVAKPSKPRTSVDKSPGASPVSPEGAGGASPPSGGAEKAPDGKGGAPAEESEVLSTDRLEQAETVLRTVEAVLHHIDEHELVGSDAVMYIMYHSVDVQRVATLQQLALLNAPTLSSSINKRRSLWSGAVSANSTNSAGESEEPSPRNLAPPSHRRATAVGDGQQAAVAADMTEVTVEIPSVEDSGLIPSSRAEDPDDLRSVPASGEHSQRATTLHSAVGSLRMPNPRDSEIVKLLRSLVLVLPLHTRDVQVAAATGIKAMLPNVDARTMVVVYEVLLPMVNACASAARSHWIVLHHSMVASLDAADKHRLAWPTAVEHCGESTSTAARLFGAELLGILLAALPELGLRALPLFQALANDVDVAVRLAAASTLPVLAAALPVGYVKDELIVVYVNLLLDADLGVTSVAFSALLDLCAITGDAFTHQVIQPIVRQYIDTCPPLVSGNVIANYGRVLWNLHKTMQPVPMAREPGGNNGSDNANTPRSSAAVGGSVSSAPDIMWVTSSSLGGVASSASVFASTTRDDMAMAGLVEHPDWMFHLRQFSKYAQSGDEEWRRLCAFNVPAVFASVPASFVGGVTKLMVRLSSDPAAKVRATLAAGFHEVCKMSAGVGDILVVFAKLLSDTDIPVRVNLVKHLDQILESIAGKTAPETHRGFFSSVTPLLVAYEKEIHTNWRRTEVLLGHFGRFPGWFPAGDLFSQFLPVLVAHLVTGAAALNRNTCHTIARFLRRHSTVDECVQMLLAVHRLVAALARNQSAAGRIGYIDLCVEIMSQFSAAFFMASWLEALLPLVTDRVPNVRAHVAVLIPHISSVPLLNDVVQTSMIKPLLRDADVDVRRAAAAAVEARILFNEAVQASREDVEEVLLLPSTTDAFRRALADQQAAEAAAKLAPSTPTVSRTASSARRKTANSTDRPSSFRTPTQGTTKARASSTS